MGQTLTHGVYLPDEGERNCYSGLAANWQLLDGAVGTVADHTAQIAGKAPAGHTHIKSDVTDLFNSANTWTALNGYRKGIWLDGAREAYIFPESAASYSGLTFATETYSQSFKFGDFTTSNDEVSFNYNNAYLSISAGYYSSDNKNKIGIEPRNADESSLGTSSYQWNKLYAKNYYYNGVAWGLDTFNQWTGNNKFVSPNTNFGFKNTIAEAGSLTASSNWIYWQDKNDFQDAYIARDIWSDGSDSLRIAITSKRSNGAPSTSGTEVGCGVRLDLYADGERNFNPFGDGVTNLGGDGYRWKNVYSVGVLGNVFETYPGSTDLLLRSTDQTWENGSRIFLYSNMHTGQTNGSIYIDVDHGDENHTKSGVILLPGVFYPVGGGTNGIKLGDSTYKWKSINGINPGSLSLPTTDTSKIDYFNGDITDKTGGANNKTFAVDGWITVIIPNVSGDFIAIDNSIGQTVSISGTGVGHSSIDISCPVRAGVQVTILCKCSGGSVIAAHTWCQGNV